MKSKFVLLVALLLFVACDNKFDWIKPPVVLPIVDAIAPDIGTEGTEVAITGSYFSGTLANNRVSINGTPAKIIKASATLLLIIAPNATTGPVLVTVNDQNADNKPVFTYP